MTDIRVFDFLGDDSSGEHDMTLELLCFMFHELEAIFTMFTWVAAGRRHRIDLSQALPSCMFPRCDLRKEGETPHSAAARLGTNCDCSSSSPFVSLEGSWTIQLKETFDSFFLGLDCTGR